MRLCSLCQSFCNCIVIDYSEDHRNFRHNDGELYWRRGKFHYIADDEIIRLEWWREWGSEEHPLEVAIIYGHVSIGPSFIHNGGHTTVQKHTTSRNFTNCPGPFSWENLLKKRKKSAERGTQTGVAQGRELHQKQFNQGRQACLENQARLRLLFYHCPAIFQPYTIFTQGTGLARSRIVVKTWLLNTLSIILNRFVNYSDMQPYRRCLIYGMNECVLYIFIEIRRRFKFICA